MKMNLSLDIFNWILNIDTEIMHRSSLQKPETGYVYLIQAREREKRGLFKIGQTKHLSKRLKEIGRQVDSLLDVIRVVAVADPRYAEATFHKVFKEKRIQNHEEWFTLNKDDVALFANIASLIGRLIQVENFTIGEIDGDSDSNDNDNGEVLPFPLSFSSQALLEFFDYGLENNFARDRMRGHDLPSGLYVTKRMWERCIARLKDLDVLYFTGHRHRMLVQPKEARQMILASMGD